MARALLAGRTRTRARLLERTTEGREGMHLRLEAAAAGLSCLLVVMGCGGSSGEYEPGGGAAGEGSGGTSSGGAAGEGSGAGTSSGGAAGAGASSGGSGNGNAGSGNAGSGSAGSGNSGSGSGGAGSGPGNPGLCAPGIACGGLNVCFEDCFGPSCCQLSCWCDTDDELTCNMDCT